MATLYEILDNIFGAYFEDNFLEQINTFVYDEKVLESPLTYIDKNGNRWFIYLKSGIDGKNKYLYIDDKNIYFEEWGEYYIASINEENKKYYLLENISNENDKKLKIAYFPDDSNLENFLEYDLSNLYEDIDYYYYEYDRLSEAIFDIDNYYDIDTIDDIENKIKYNKYFKKYIEENNEELPDIKTMFEEFIQMEIENENIDKTIDSLSKEELNDYVDRFLDFIDEMELSSIDTNTLLKNISRVIAFEKFKSEYEPDTLSKDYVGDYIKITGKNNKKYKIMFEKPDSDVYGLNIRMDDKNKFNFLLEDTIVDTIKSVLKLDKQILNLIILTDENNTIKLENGKININIC